MKTINTVGGSVTVLRGHYGSQRISCDVFVLENDGAGYWYVAEGGQTVNLTLQNLTDGVWVDDVDDVDCYTWDKPITDADEMLRSLYPDEYKYCDYCGALRHVDDLIKLVDGIREHWCCQCGEGKSEYDQQKDHLADRVDEIYDRIKHEKH